MANILVVANLPHKTDTNSRILSLLSSSKKYSLHATYRTNKRKIFFFKMNIWQKKWERIKEKRKNVCCLGGNKRTKSIFSSFVSHVCVICHHSLSLKATFFLAFTQIMHETYSSLSWRKITNEHDNKTFFLTHEAFEWNVMWNLDKTRKKNLHKKILFRNENYTRVAM